MAFATRLVLTASLALTACTGASPSASVSGSVAAVSITATETTAPSVASPAPSEAPGHIAVVVTDMALRLSSAAAATGELTFDVQNIPSEPPFGNVHELVVIHTDLDAADLPTLKEANGLVTGVIEDGLDIVGRTAHLAVGGSESLTLNLEAGHYVLFCNLTGHYMFMRQNFDVH
jgi:uncharacterized cupredoxin-like copper-binding protein